LDVVERLHAELGPNLWLMHQKLAPNDIPTMSSTSLVLISSGGPVHQPTKPEEVLQREHTYEQNGKRFLLSDVYVFSAAEVF